MAKKAATTRGRAANVEPKTVRITATADGLKNILSGMGGAGDKLASTFFVAAAADQTQLDAAYRGDWISRKGVDIPAFDATREWRSWQADPDQITKIESVEKKIFLQQKTMVALQKARLYGGAALVMGVDDGQSQDQPLNLDAVKPGALKFVHAVSKFEMTSGQIETDITSPYYNEPTYYMVNGAQSGQIKIHPSRLVRFLGNPILDPKQSPDGWGDSILSSVTDAIMGAGMVTNSVAQLVAEAKIDVIKLPGFSQNIETQEYEDNLKKRFEVSNYAKSVYRILLMDKEEEWERIEANFTSLPDIQKLFLLIASGAFDIPATRFLSQSPSGLTATGESDIRNYYDRCSTVQKIDIQPALKRLDDVVLRSAIGPMDDGEADAIFYEWNPLWQLSDTEKATIAQNYANVFKIDVDAGLLNRVVLKKARENQLIEAGTYPGLEQIIDEFDDNPDLENEEDAGNSGAQDPLLLPAPQPGSVPPGQASGTPPAAATDALPAAGGRTRAVMADMARRIRLASTDASSTPRPLYVRRDVLNGNDIRRWAKSQGFDSVVDDLHVTIIYSKTPVDWLKVGSDDWGSDQDGNLTVKAGGPRVIEQFGEGAIVLAFANSQLQYRHMCATDAGCSFDYDDYTPHVTITYKKPDGLDVAKVDPYRGEIQLGPEIFEEITESFDPKDAE